MSLGWCLKATAAASGIDSIASYSAVHVHMHANCACKIEIVKKKHCRDLRNDVPTRTYVHAQKKISVQLTMWGSLRLAPNTDRAAVDMTRVGLAQARPNNYN